MLAAQQDLAFALLRCLGFGAGVYTIALRSADSASRSAANSTSQTHQFLRLFCVWVLSGPAPVISGCRQTTATPRKVTLLALPSAPLHAVVRLTPRRRVPCTMCHSPSLCLKIILSICVLFFPTTSRRCFPAASPFQSAAARSGKQRSGWTTQQRLYRPGPSTLWVTRGHIRPANFGAPKSYRQTLTRCASCWLSAF